MSKNISQSLVKNRRMILFYWTIFAAFFFLYVIFILITNLYGPKTSKVWSWILMVIWPPIPLMLGLHAKSTVSNLFRGPNASKIFFRWTKYISLFYLTICTFFIIGAPVWTSMLPEARVAEDLLDSSKEIFVVILSLVTAFIGSFFSYEPDELKEEKKI